ncbi:hypothetical protein MNBD_PLANCTO02-1466, partial [hydrothermal vent metagenome]
MTIFSVSLTLTHKVIREIVNHGSLNLTASQNHKGDLDTEILRV